ncbi:MAG: peptidoglycan DD-metalloendopeptidase family protein [Clostridiales bacterium]|nr:peptidoglycan DD-metalloendopeptidase family protein [Clostridiales bacterium]
MLATVGSGIAGAAGGTSYLAEDGDIDAAELAYTEWETDLYLEAMNAERSHPGYDEYRYNIAHIGHNPYELMAYLTAVFDDFTFSDTVAETVTIEVGAEIGQVRTSAYCACSICCGPYANGITASGTTATANRTIAVDAYNPLLPMGTKVVINGIQYTVEDTGNLNTNNVDIDIFFATHAEALAWGKQTHTAYLAEGNENSLEVTIAHSGVEAHLREIFNEQYALSFVEEVERRSRTEYYYDEDGNRHSETVYYDYYILNVNLTARSFTSIVYNRMVGEQLERYNVYMVTKGNRQYLQSPFGDTNWLPYVSSYYGYRVHPISGTKDLHRGVDIALPASTEILAGQSGTVTFAGSSGDYGLVVVLDDGEGLVSKYAHCSALLVSEGQAVEAGDVIARVGSTGNSTGPHLHLEILKDGQYLNPLYFAVTNDYGQGPVYGDAGSAMGDGSYAALIEEAERHLGKAYVFGASGPNNFDCSGYICWIFTQSGVYNLPRTTAQGIYNQCTPIPASEAQPGDIIFFHSTYSTADTVTHVGLYVGNGMMIHCGHPIQYTSINSSYWQSHFYAFGRLPTN